MGTGNDPFSKKGIIDPVRCFCSDGRDTDIVDKEHDDGKNGECQETVCDNAVDFIRNSQTMLVFFDEAFFDDF